MAKPTCCLITANVGSLFEKPESILSDWINEFCDFANTNHPLILALHMQEVGGKRNDWGKNKELINEFISRIYSHSIFSDYKVGFAVLDQDHDSPLFTALGSAYFIHESICEQVRVFSFQTQTFTSLPPGKKLHFDISNFEYVKRSKFPVELFPNGRISRKGFLQSRWQVHGRTYEFVNIHLFHDDSNLIAMQKSPSSYSINRRHALEYCLQQLNMDSNVFIFGDFNFRLDTCALTSFIKSELAGLVQRTENNSYCLSFPNSIESVLSVEPKKFHVGEKQYFKDDCKVFRAFDNESSAFPELFECSFSFPPTYPFKEDEISGYNFSRCPAWCDRILFTCAAWKSLNSNMSNVEYGMLGRGSKMGDHKPIYLLFDFGAFSDINDSS